MSLDKIKPQPGFTGVPSIGMIPLFEEITHHTQLSLEQIVGVEGQEKILRGNDLARKAYLVKMKNDGKSSWVSSLPSERDQ